MNRKVINILKTSFKIVHAVQWVCLLLLCFICCGVTGSSRWCCVPKKLTFVRREKVTGSLGILHAAARQCCNSNMYISVQAFPCVSNYLFPQKKIKKYAWYNAEQNIFFTFIRILWGWYDVCQFLQSEQSYSIIYNLKRLFQVKKPKSKEEEKTHLPIKTFQSFCGSHFFRFWLSPDLTSTLVHLPHRSS